MRLPGRADLSLEQEKIFLEAPLSENILIEGPPGTGKTVLAILRAYVLSKKKIDFDLIMFNRVLRSYTQIPLRNANLQDKVSTWHSWVSSWWRKGTRTTIPSISKYDYDFDSALNKLVANDISPEKLGWEHLIIDEGQDFPKKFYELLGYITFDEKIAKRKQSTLTVLADEHQRLEASRHSTILDIIKGLTIPPNQTYRLTENFRNTREIALFTSNFYVGNNSDLPTPPEDRRGRIPEFRKFNSSDEEIRYIFKYARNNDDQDIAIFVSTSQKQVELIRKLEPLALGAGIRLQAYSSQLKQYSDTDNLIFGQKGSITVLTDKSCKGLEFDAVFIPQLNSYKTAGVEEDFIRMRMYVMSSRARNFLSLSYSDAKELPAIAQLLPQNDAGLLKWKINQKLNN